MRSFGPDPAHWTPARYVAHWQRCSFCGAHIPRSAPGARTGERGTKAFYNAALNLWECIDCRLEASRADQARLAEREPQIERCSSCGYERLDSHRASAAPIFRLSPCAGCGLNAGRGLHRICPRCAGVEHRSHPTVRELEGAA